MHIKLGLQWFADGHRRKPVDRRLFPLLAEVHNTGSIGRAATAVGLSYRFAWGLIRNWESAFGQTLLITGRGRRQGARLSDFAHALLTQDKTVHTQLLPVLDECAARINTDLNLAQTQAGTGHVKILASHDLVMNLLVGELRTHAGWDIDYEVHGSLGNLRALAKHDCDIAGFHFPLEFPDKSMLEHYDKYLRRAQAGCLAVTTREQGLIVQAGNPKGIQSIRDLTRRSVRFINRQVESGTRILTDALLRQEGIKPERISGYLNEEYTHNAVAAMVASGAADAGMGLKAAARQFHLDFIPLVRERYCLALAPELDGRFSDMLGKALRSGDLKKKIGRIPGYHPSGIGKAVPLDRLFA